MKSHRLGPSGEDVLEQVLTKTKELRDRYKAYHSRLIEADGPSSYSKILQIFVKELEATLEIFSLMPEDYHDLP